MTWQISETARLEQFKLIYDYIKFHIGLYLATPTVMAIIAEAFSAQSSIWFRSGLIAMIFTYFAAGIHAGLFMGRNINHRWDEHFLHRVESEAFSRTRRIMHHTLYWIGLAFGLTGLVLAVLNQ